MTVDPGGWLANEIHSIIAVIHLGQQAVPKRASHIKYWQCQKKRGCIQWQAKQASIKYRQHQKGPAYQILAVPKKGQTTSITSQSLSNHQPEPQQAESSQKAAKGQQEVSKSPATKQQEDSNTPARKHHESNFGVEYKRNLLGSIVGILSGQPPTLHDCIAWIANAIIAKCSHITQINIATHYYTLRYNTTIIYIIIII